ncbi:MAG TPA: hypothetical protein PK095_25895, partial [Myxococcota bacterium]|nr:hypothetical protein [Myxococcota bacterium]
GAVVAVFSLAALLGSAERQQTAGQTWSSPLPMASRWFALVASSALAPTERIALAFEHLVERVRLPIAKDAPRVAFYRTERGVIPILDPAELVARVTANTVAGQET